MTTVELEEGHHNELVDSQGNVIEQSESEVIDSDQTSDYPIETIQISIKRRFHENMAKKLLTSDRMIWETE